MAFAETFNECVFLENLYIYIYIYIFPAVARFNFLDFPENFKNCFRLHRKRRNPGCSLAVEYLYKYIKQAVEYL